MHCQGGIGFGEDYIRIFTFLGRPIQARDKDKKTKELFPFLKVLDEYPSVSRFSTNHSQLCNK